MKLKIIVLLLMFSILNLYAQNTKKIAYLTADINIPFWKTMAEGIKEEAKKYNYQIDIYGSKHNSKDELINLAKILKSDYSALITSPTNSSNAVTILRMAKTKNIPVVIADIGTEAGEYVSYISSNNYKGAQEVGKALLNKLEGEKGSVGIISIPQTRENGKQRTKGFLDAIKYSGINVIGIKQLKEWTYDESYLFTKDFIKKHKDLKAIWVQTSNTAQGILDAIKDENKENDVLFFAFDAEPDFLKLIKDKKIIATGMQQPFYIGQKALDTVHKHLNNIEVKRKIQLDILLVSSSNIDQNMKKIKRNVFGMNE